MQKRKVGILTFSDGRKSVHREVLRVNQESQERLAEALENTGEVDVVRGSEIIWTPQIARREGERLLREKVEVTIFNFAVWAFPHLPVIAAEFAPGPFLLFSSINPKYPGMVGMLATAGALDQIGEFHSRIWGRIEDEEVLEKVMAFIRAVTTVKRLKGESFGLFGGRPMGMYTAVANPDQWRKDFGIDVEHIDQMEIVRRSLLVSPKKVNSAFEWLEKYVAKIHYDGKQLTPEKLKTQIKSYYAVREIIEEKNLDFVGIKAQPELTDNFVTMDVTEAFLNDPYDWDGPHDSIVAATEADMDGALTMEIMKHLSGEPVLFADVRHYDEEDNFFDLCNSGSHPTYYAGKSKEPEQNLKNVHLYPQGFYFPAGGASVHHIAQPGKVTIARLARRKGKYWMAIIPAEFLQFSPDKAKKKAAATTLEWPHAFARFEVNPDEFLSQYDSNHCHAIYGDYVTELIWVARVLGIDYKIFK